MIEIISIGRLGKGYIVHYDVTLRNGCCGLVSIRHSMYLDRKTKPTDKQAKQAIENELNNK